MAIRQSETMDRQIRQSHPQNQGLTRALSFFDVICLGINSVVGAGILLFPGNLCSLAGDAALWVFPLCGGRFVGRLEITSAAPQECPFSVAVPRDAREAFGP